MTCQQVQTSLSLYLYGELDFALEDALETHLQGCAFCERALAREKEWHAALNSERRDVPFELLSDCRRDLRMALHAESTGGLARAWWARIVPGGFSATRWSAQIALASFLLFVGFAAARLLDSSGTRSFSADQVSRMGLWDPSTMHVTDVQPTPQGAVRIILDRVQQQEVTGRLEDDTVRRLLLTAMQDASDPCIRVDSLEILQHQTGADVRDALLNTAKNDANAAVRVKALEGLRHFTDEPAVRKVVENIVKRDNSPEVRSEAIDVLLAPETSVRILTPDVVTTLQDLITSQHQDDYVRSRSLQVLRALSISNPVY
jgi:hypothetical protein